MGPRNSARAAFAQRNLLPLWFATLLFSIGLESLFTFTRTFVDERQVGTAGLFFAVYGVTAAVTRYRDPTACRRSLDRHVAYGMIHRRADGGLAATERGLAFLAELYQVHAVTEGTDAQAQVTVRLEERIDA